MSLTFRSDSYFPFAVPTMDSSFASSVGARTVYPVGFSLERVLEIYWSARNYTLVAAGDGVKNGVTQALRANQILPPRNVGVGTNTYYVANGFTPRAPGDLVTGSGVRQLVSGTGTVTASGGGTNTAARFNLLVDLFFPEIFAADPVVKYDGKWWPALSVSCSVANDVPSSGGGQLRATYQCDSFDPASTVVIGSFTFFGQAVTVSCASLAAGETRSFSGSLSVADVWT